VADLLIDSDVFIDHLRGAHELRARGDRLHYSVITRAELLAGTSATGYIDQLLAPFREHPVDRVIAERAGGIRHEHGLRLPDALIAATALTHELTLLTRNVKDFRGVGGLRVRPPR